MKLYLTTIGIAMAVVAAVNMIFKPESWLYIVISVFWCTALQFALDGLIAILIRITPDRYYGTENKHFEVSPFSKKLGKLLHVRKWKDKVWELGGMGGFSKRSLVDPLQFEMSIQAEDLSSYVPSFGWEMSPPTDKQKNSLEKLGILPDIIDNAGKAQMILDRLSKRREEGLTTPKQIRCLERYGFKHVGEWQFDAAKKLIDRIAANYWRVPGSIDPKTYTPSEV